MKIIGINCSPRKGQTTQKSLEVCLKAIGNESDDIETVRLLLLSLLILIFMGVWVVVTVKNSSNANRKMILIH